MLYGIVRKNNESCCVQLHQFYQVLGACKKARDLYKSVKATKSCHVLCGSIKATRSRIRAIPSKLRSLLCSGKASANYTKPIDVQCNVVKATKPFIFMLIPSRCGYLCFCAIPLKTRNADYVRSVSWCQDEPLTNQKGQPQLFYPSGIIPHNFQGYVPKIVQVPKGVNLAGYASNKNAGNGRPKEAQPPHQVQKK